MTDGMHTKWPVRRVTFHGGPKDGRMEDIPAISDGDGYAPVLQWRPANVGDPVGEVRGVYLRRSASSAEYDWHSEELV